MIEFLIFGGFWFWFFFIICSVILLYHTIFSEYLFGIWLVGILLFVLFIVSGGINFAWLIANPLTALMWIGIYIGAGLIWSMKEWYSFAAKEIETWFVSQRDNTPWFVRQGDNTPRAKNHWGNITTWIVYFPYFILAWALTDPIKKIAQQFTFVYDGISNHLYKKAMKKRNNTINKDKNNSN